MNLHDILVVLLEKIVDLLEAELFKLSSLSGELESLQSELEIMMSFVKDLSDQLVQKQCLTRFLNEVETTLIEVNDILEHYFIDYASTKSKVGYVKRFCFGSPNKVNDNKLTSLKDDIRAYNKSLDLLGIKKTTIIKGVTFTSPANKQENYHDVVGLENDVEKLVKILVDEEVQEQTICCNVIAISGMGGIGKTTLAKLVYNDREVRSHFEGFSWTKVPQNYQTRYVLEDIFLQLVPESEETIKTFSNIELVQKLYEVQLSKKFLIVLDDVWNEDIWTCLTLAFPSRNTASKLILTTRSKQVAETIVKKIADRGITHTMRTLTEEESWNLFLKKASLGTISGEMKVVGKNLVNECRGLPLAIVLLANILVTKHTFNEWKIVCQCIRGQLRSPKFSEMPRDLALITYHELPYHLKPCFLYLGVFPEDSDIELKQLYRLWIAEGFIQSNSGKSNTKMEIAECYLDELIKRRMVQVQERRTPTKRWFKTIHLNDMMRDICLLKAREENIMEVMDLRKSNQLQQCYPKTSRLSLHIDENEDNHHVKFKNGKIAPLRTLLVLNLGKNMTLPPALSSFKALKSLTVLYFDGLSFVNKKELKWIGELIRLRFLSFNRCLIDELPSTIGNLFNLCTLDLQVQTSIRIPNTLWKIQRLKHLYLPLRFGVYRNEKLRLNSLIHLETLKNFDASLCNAEDLDQLTKLRMLRITTGGNLDHLTAITHHLTKNSKSEKRQTILRKLLECPTMCKLHIDGLVSHLPQAISPNLIKLVLSGTEIVADPMPTLEKFPKLRVLTLRNDAFLGKRLVFSALGFFLLKDLTLATLPKLESLSIEEGAMPNLTTFTITKCDKLEVLPVKYRGNGENKA